MAGIRMRGEDQLWLSRSNLRQVDSSYVAAVIVVHRGLRVIWHLPLSPRELTGTCSHGQSFPSPSPNNLWHSLLTGCLFPTDWDLFPTANPVVTRRCATVLTRICRKTLSDLLLLRQVPDEYYRTRIWQEKLVDVVLLDLQENRLTDLPDDFLSRMVSLRKLSLSKNR